MHKKGTAGKKVRGAGEGGFQQRAAVCSACIFCYTDNLSHTASDANMHREVVSNIRGKHAQLQL